MSQLADLQKILIDHLIRARDAQDAHSRFLVWQDCMYTLGYDGDEIEELYLEAIDNNAIALRPFFQLLKEFTEEI